MQPARSNRRPTQAAEHVKGEAQDAKDKVTNQAQDAAQNVRDHSANS